MFTQFAILGLGTTELVVILLIVLLLFGSKKLPELSRSVGQSMSELRKGINDGKETKTTKKQDNN
jgi:sec-independent protein translocase protein TatA